MFVVKNRHTPELSDSAIQNSYAGGVD